MRRNWMITFHPVRRRTGVTARLMKRNFSAQRPVCSWMVSAGLTPSVPVSMPRTRSATGTSARMKTATLAARVTGPDYTGTRAAPGRPRRRATQALPGEPESDAGLETANVAASVIERHLGPQKELRAQTDRRAATDNRREALGAADRLEYAAREVAD